MRRFDEIIDLAAQRRGGPAALEKALAETRALAAADIAAIPDDRVLAAMASSVQPVVRAIRL